MRSLLLIALAVSCPTFSLKTPTLVTDPSSDSAGNDNSVFAAEEAMQHQFKSTPKKPKNANAGGPLPSATATSGIASAGTAVQPKVISWQEQRAQVTKLAKSEQEKLRTEINQRSAAQSEVRRLQGLVLDHSSGLSAAEAVIRSKLGSKALEDVRLDSEKHLADAVKGELGTAARTVTTAAVQSQLEAMRSQLTASQHQAAASAVKLQRLRDEQGNADSPQQNTSDMDIDPEVEKVQLELQAVAVELNSSNTALQSQNQSLTATIASLHSEQGRRTAAEKTSAVETIALRHARAKISAEAVSLASTNATLAKTVAHLRRARAKLRSATASHMSAADQAIQKELQASRAETKGLRQKLGRVVEMVQKDLAAKDKEASDAIAAEHATTEKALADLAAGQRELQDLRAQSADLSTKNHKLRAMAQAQQQ